MKKILLIILSVLFVITAAHSQNASTFFPANPGYKWYFKNTPLDSNNNPIISLVTYRIDSFAYTANYKGLLASHVLSKSNLINFNQAAPWNDTFYYNFQTTNGWEYMMDRVFPDTIPPSLLDPIINFLKSLENWYSVYRFAQTVNSQYTVYTKDTTFSIDTLTLPLRFSYKGRRLNDETVSTVNGNYLAKKFVFISGIAYLIVLPPPLPSIEVPIIQRPDTVWIAQNVWVVKDYIPSTNVDLSPVGITFSINIPGQITELANPTSGIKNISTTIPENINLYQNYPNPFNPVTKIRFDLNKFAKTTLKIFDINGREISTLISAELNPGTYETEFDASNISSGVYFYRLTTADETLTKQMMVVK
jgi:hypothetical protein